MEIVEPQDRKLIKTRRAQHRQASQQAASMNASATCLEVRTVQSNAFKVLVEALKDLLTGN